MNRWNVRVWIGAGLIVLGLLLLLERLGLFRGIISIFWTLIFLAAGGWFLYRFVTHMGSDWWAAIPGFALVGIAGETLLSDVMAGWGGAFVLGGFAAGFFAVYFSGRERWWAIIPGGVFLTLAAITVLSNAFGVHETGGFVLVGFGLTFVLVAVLAGLMWAWIPGVVLLIIGVALGMQSEGMFSYLWPAALILGGLLLIAQFLRRPH